MEEKDRLIKSHGGLRRMEARSPENWRPGHDRFAKMLNEHGCPALAEHGTRGIEGLFLTLIVYNVETDWCDNRLRMPGQIALVDQC